MVWLLCFRFRQKSIDRAIDLTDSFTWQDLPTRDADTGHLTAAGWIPLIMKFSRSAAIAMLCFHTVQSTIRIVTNHETQYNAWYPFDWTVSPFYEIVNISQVTISKTELSSVCFYSITHLTNLVDWHSVLFISVPLPSLFLQDAVRLQTLVIWKTKRNKKEFSIRPSWYNQPEFVCRTERENEIIRDIRCFAGTWWIPIHGVI